MVSNLPLISNYNWNHSQFLIFWLGPSTSFFFFLPFFIFTQWSTRMAKIHLITNSLLGSLGHVFWAELGDLFASQNPKGFYAFHFLGWILDCVFTIWYYCQNSISFTITCWSHFRPIHTQSCTLFMLVYCILLLYDKSFLHIIYIRYSITFYSFFIIIIMSCRQHGYPWPSLATSPYHSSLLAGLQGYITYPHIAAVCMFELVIVLLLGHMWGSIGVHHW